MTCRRVTVVLSTALSVAAVLLASCGGGSDAPEGDSTQSPAKADAEPLPPPPKGVMLQRIRARGALNCGVHEGLVGFAYRDNRGRWRGFDVDFCRATAAAIFGDPSRVRFVPVRIDQRFQSVRDGRVDVLWRNTSWTAGRDANEGVDFPGVNYFDGQGFLVRRSLNLTSATELVGARVCVQSGSTSELNLVDFFGARNIRFEAVPVRSEEQARQTYAREACDAYSADVSALAAARSTMNNPAAHVILPEVVSKEPLGPVVREGDHEFADVIRWVLIATVAAEEMGVTSENLDETLKTSRNAEIRRLFGLEGDIGSGLGLRKDWAADVVRSVGNYGEIFDRNVGQDSPLRLERGMNALWNAEPDGGLMYAPPIR